VNWDNEPDKHRIGQHDCATGDDAKDERSIINDSDKFEI
jgi:hypothetical protein